MFGERLGLEDFFILNGACPFSFCYECFLLYECGMALRRVCIVGSGPGGFYVAENVLQKFPSCRVEMMESLPVPFGLVRFGVAPDHPEVKAVSKVFSKLAQNDRFRFWGNVTLGADVSVKDLVRNGACDAVVLAYGASEDRLLGIRGEEVCLEEQAASQKKKKNNKKMDERSGSAQDISNSIVSARDFVAWYNGHPRPQSELDSLDAIFTARLTGSEKAVVVGNGNVALDCARMLLANSEYLGKYDCPPPVVDILGRSTIQEVAIVGRRGPIQSSFTNKELREMLDLAKSGAFALHVAPEELALNDASTAEKDADRPKKRQWDLWTQIGQQASSAAAGSKKRCTFRFLTSPTSYQDGRLSLQPCVLKGEPNRQRSVPTGSEPEIVSSSLVLRSIGYASKKLDADVPFDAERRIVPSDRGYVQDHVFVSGWLKRGPSGIIGTNKWDADETVQTMVEKAIQNSAYCPHRFDELLAPLEGQIFRWSDVDRILEWEALQGYKIRSLEAMRKVTGKSE
ncbi:mitochondrial iron-sulfur cluster biosynthesis Arh1 (ferredoxin/adrenoxdoxin reductase) [Andalucia godoyi]|uniref:NADPH:adrenodoxin oxidoreductase, mitochondrial n=1 Tax=Andalucia godoyi TaxID=505711 RepID=A0A8K0AIS1_ANDGO|nr:mitochondrial iron-sulfur cluster biosynthesis Arh1 (ferredoxin/adrenoxdoxin reductase) [Andalucia godoyi]|eukprot:ANDGO_07566.mRNA.1 mitochondrial iron-sulfur cluster biosynthesis Arh1 (ferredoxin/adrenoxdoxin reductase)